MITIISGSRRIEDYRIVEAAIAASGFVITEVVEGGQRTWDRDRNTIIGGVDYFAEVWARRNHVPWRRINAEWSIYGKAAGAIRNREMAAIGEQLIAVPDSDSRGTIDMIEAAKEAGYTPEHVFVYYDPDLFPEGPTGCLDDNDELSQALRQVTHEQLNKILKESQ